MAGGLRDRFQLETYDGDEPVHLFRADKYGTNDGGVWMPERIWHRLRWVATAYELHLLPLLDGSTDPVWVRAVISLSAERSEGASKDTVGIEFP